MQIRDRIKDFRRVKASELADNTMNWRKHPKVQVDAMQAVLREIGFADALLVRETSDGLMLIDGHLRKSLAPDMEVPVLVLDVDEHEAYTILATLDPLSSMAETDAVALDALLREVSSGESVIQEMLAEMAKNAGLVSLGDEWNDALSLLPDGEKDPFQKMEFILSDQQAEVVKKAVAAAKSAGSMDDTGNENSNGNALARICEVYLG